LAFKFHEFRGKRIRPLLILFRFSSILKIKYSKNGCRNGEAIIIIEIIIAMFLKNSPFLAAH